VQRKAFSQECHGCAGRGPCLPHPGLVRCALLKVKCTTGAGYLGRLAQGRAALSSRARQDKSAWAARRWRWQVSSLPPQSRTLAAKSVTDRVEVQVAPAPTKSSCTRACDTVWIDCSHACVSCQVRRTVVTAELVSRHGTCSAPRPIRCLTAMLFSAAESSWIRFERLIATQSTHACAAVDLPFVNTAPSRQPLGPNWQIQADRTMSNSDDDNPWPGTVCPLLPAIASTNVW
jgi:hypothetical protein